MKIELGNIETFKFEIQDLKNIDKDKILHIWIYDLSKDTEYVGEIKLNLMNSECKQLKEIINKAGE